MKLKSVIAFTVGLGITFNSMADISPDRAYYLQHPEARAFIDNMVDEHQFSREYLENLFAQIDKRADIIEAISNPAEAKPWYQYRKIFLVEKRIQGGVDFWQKHQQLLQRAERETGVPARIIVAILGVETLYNRYKGRHDVLESLATLAFDYPKRSRFFRSELEQFLLLAREENVDPLTLKGSYAGAMGGPQFISSSYRRYAVDFDGDGKRDIWTNTADMIGSVANYFKVHGWQRDEPITYPTNVSGTQYRSILGRNIKPRHSLAELSDKGISTPDGLQADTRAALIELETQEGKQYWLGLNNFYVITRYNHSALYAMAVYQLSEEISKRLQTKDKT